MVQWGCLAAPLFGERLAEFGELTCEPHIGILFQECALWEHWRTGQDGRVCMHRALFITLDVRAS